jgi:predicted amidohydrolase YtcJ
VPASVPQLPADLAVVNGKIWTVDRAHPGAEALAIVGERIAAVGTAEEIRAWIGPRTEVLDARGGSVLPGFIDAHVHFASGGAELSGVQLRDAATPAEFERRIAECARRTRPGEWICGGLWDHELWGGAEPTREWIDAAASDTPVFVSRYDSHMGLTNSVALRLAGITRDTPQPDGGTIVKDAAGNPTGLLKDAAMSLVFRAIPPQTEEQHIRAVRAAMAEARRFGITGIHDISSARDVPLYQNLAARGELTLRIYCMTPIQQWEGAAATGVRAASGDDWVRVGAVKGFSDGSLGATTAYFFEPYCDAPETCGLLNEMMFPEGNMLKMARGADRAGLQLAIHAIGDRANRMVLDIFSELQKEGAGRAERRWRIEHAQHVRPEDFEDFARLGVIASVQPYHAIDDARWAEKRIGRERCRTTCALRNFLERGVRLAFGTDWSVAPLNPLLTLYAAVTRAPLDGKSPEGWFPEQKLTLAEAIEAYTLGSAYAGFREHELGSLTPGKLADVAVLEADLFSLPAEQIREINVSATVVGGKIIFARDLSRRASCT